MPVLNDLKDLPFNKWPRELNDDDIVSIWGNLPAETKKNLMAQRTPLNNSILHWAIERRFEKTVHKLLDEGMDVSLPGEMNQTPLHLAAYYNDAVLAERLLAAGANQNATRDDNEMPIHIAAMMGAADVVEVILKHDKSQLGALGRESATPFVRAVNSNKLAVIDVLLRHGDDINQLSKYTGQGGLHSAAIKNRHELIGGLLTRGANVDLCSTGGLTALQFCALQRKPSLLAAEKLLAAGADVNAGDESILNLLDRNASKQASETEKLKQLLIERGAKSTDGRMSSPSV